jgi:hypothetical protein
MSEMIERVARKLQELGAAFPASPMMFEQMQMAALPGGSWRRYENPARALLKAMREPTFDMANLICNDEDLKTEDGAERWRAAIDEALK